MKNSVYIAWGLCAALLVTALFLADIAFHHNGDITHAIRIGSEFYERPGVAELVRKSKPTIYQDIGFDGQFFYFLAHDPMLLNKATIHGLDAPHLRARRIMFPILARLLVSHRAHIPRGMLWALIISITGSALLASSMLKTQGAPPVLAFFSVMTVTIATASEYFTAEVVATFFIFLSFWAFRREKYMLCWIGTAAAILAKEPAAALMVVFVFISLKHRQWRRAVLFASTILPFLLWSLYLAIRLPGNPASTGMAKNFTFPFLGALPAFSEDISQILTGENQRVYLLRAVSRLWFLITAIGLAGIFIYRQTAATAFGLLASLNIMLLSSGEHNPCYDYMSHFARQLFLAPPALFMVYLESRKRFFLALLIVLSILSISTWYLLIKGKFI